MSSRSWSYRSGNSALEAGDLKTAESRVQAAVGDYDERPDWIQRLGLIQERRRKYEDALFSYYRAIGLDSSRAEWYYRAGVCARELGRITEANELFEYAVDRDHNHKRAADALGATIPNELPGWRRMELLERALGASDNIGTMREAARLAYAMKRYSEATRFIDSIQQVGSESAEDLVLLGSALASSREIRRAYEVLVEASNRKGHKEAIAHSPGVLLDQRGEWENAFRIHEVHWLESAGENRFAAFGAAYALDRQYRWKQALDWYEKALESSSDHTAYWAYKYAHAFERNEDYDNAIIWYSRALDLGGNRQWDWFYRLGSCLYTVGRYVEASVALRRWLLKRLGVGTELASSSEARLFDPYSHYDESTGLTNLQLISNSFDLTLQANSRRIAIDIDSQLVGVASVPAKYLAKARQDQETGNLIDADRNYGIAYDASGRSTAQTLAEWSEILIRGREFKKVCRLILDHREFARPDGLDTSKTIKSDFDRRKLRYAEYRSRFGLDFQTVLFESYWGTRINDNPLAIYHAMVQDPRMDEYKFYWTWDGKSPIPKDLVDDGRTILVIYGSDHYDRVLATAEVLVNNTSFVQYFTRRAGQRYINTWHGTPLKTLGKKIGTGVLEHANVARNFLQATDLVMPNTYTAKKLCTDYDIGSIATVIPSVVGSPRIDRMLNHSVDSREKILADLGITSGTALGMRIVFYAPTWRGSATDKGQDEELILSTLQILAEFDDVLTLYRPHHMVPVVETSEVPSNVYVVDQVIDTYDLLAASDMLITDYSSLMFDYLATGRRVICYVPDIDTYRSERGLYLDPAEVISEVAYDEDALRLLLAETEVIADSKYSSSRAQYTAAEDGKASERVVDLVLTGDRTDLLNAPAEGARKSIVFFESMIPNGIRSSFENLCAQLDAEEYDLTLVLDVNQVEKSQDRQTGLGNLPDTMSVIGRVGSSLVTLEERYALAEFSKNFGVVSEQLENLVNAAYAREFQRIFSRPNNAIFIDFEGYSRFWNALFARGCPGNCRSGVILHNQMSREAEIRFPYLQEIARNYAYYSGVASVANAIDEGNREFVRKMSVTNGDSMSVVHNSMNVEAVRRAADSGRSLWGVDASSSLKIVAVGRLSPEKNQSLLLEAVRELIKARPDTRLKILGDGPSRNSLESSIQSMGLASNVEILGFVENPMPTMAGADVLALSSLHEGQPMVIFEAMSLGTPVVSTPVPGCIEAVGMGTGVIADYDPARFADAILEASNLEPSELFDVELYNSRALEEFSCFIRSM